MKYRTTDGERAESLDMVADLGLPPPDAVGMEVTGELHYWAYYHLSRSRSRGPRIHGPQRRARAPEVQLAKTLAWYRRFFPTAPLRVRWVTEYPEGCGERTAYAYRSIVDWETGRLRERPAHSIANRPTTVILPQA